MMESIYSKGTCTVGNITHMLNESQRVLLYFLVTLEYPQAIFFSVDNAVT